MKSTLAKCGGGCGSGGGGGGGGMDNGEAPNCLS